MNKQKLKNLNNYLSILNRKMNNFEIEFIMKSMKEAHGTTW